MGVRVGKAKETSAGMEQLARSSSWRTGLETKMFFGWKSGAKGASLKNLPRILPLTKGAGA